MMAITQHGPKCDVCGDYILLDKSINPFGVKGIDRELHCHDKCKDAVLATNKDWRELPVGPLRTAFEEVEKEPMP